MAEQTVKNLPSLYEQDETAWLDQMAILAAQRCVDEIDYEHLSEYLTDMAERDKRAVISRLTVLLIHVLKWQYQPERRTNSWRSTIRTQQDKLKKLLKSGMLRRHADAGLDETYQEAVVLASVETELPASAFPAKCFLSLDDMLVYAVE